VFQVHFRCRTCIMVIPSEWCCMTLGLLAQAMAYDASCLLTDNV